MKANLPSILFLASGVLFVLALVMMGDVIRWGELLLLWIWPLCAVLGVAIGRWSLSRFFSRRTSQIWSIIFAHACLLAMGAGYIGLCQIGMIYEQATSTKDSFWFAAFVLGLPVYAGIGLMLVVDIFRGAVSAARRLLHTDGRALLQ